MLSILGDALLIAMRRNRPIPDQHRHHADWSGRFVRPETLAERKRLFAVNRDLFW